MTIGGQRVFVPFVVREGMLQPMKVVLDPDQGLVPLTKDYFYSKVNIGKPVNQVPATAREQTVTTGGNALKEFRALNAVPIVKQGAYYIDRLRNRYVIYKDNKPITTVRRRELEKVASELGLYVDDFLIEHGGWTTDRRYVEMPTFIEPGSPMRFFDGGESGEYHAVSSALLKEGSIGSFWVDDFFTEPVRIEKVGKVIKARTTRGELVKIARARKYATHKEGNTYFVFVPQNAPFVKVARVEMPYMFAKDERGYLFSDGGKVQRLDESSLMEKLAAFGVVGEIARLVKEKLDEGLYVGFDKPYSAQTLLKTAQDALRKIAQGAPQMDDQLANMFIQHLNLPSTQLFNKQSISEILKGLSALLLQAEAGNVNIPVDVIVEALDAFEKLRRAIQHEMSVKELAAQG